MASTELLTRIRRYLESSAEVKRRTAEHCSEAIGHAVDLLTDAYRAGGKVLLCGNGGSAADCQHLAAELVSALHRDRPRPALGAIALTTDTSLLTASANDFGFQHVFERQVEALGRRGDVLIAITTSGNSENVLRALARARGSGLRTIVLSGSGGGQAAALADVAIQVPSDSTNQIQEAHITVGHVLCELVEQALFPV
jgi:D-sedoheptulose 7-phosphate isomerase